MKNPNLENNLKTTYTESFFSQHDPSFYPELAKAILQVCDGEIQSSLDVGCGHGFLVEALREQGVDAYGLEGSESARALWPESHTQKYTVMDIEGEQGAELVAVSQLVTSFEVAEHLSASSAAKFIQLVTTHKPRYIVFGAATPYQDLDKNPTHVNEQSFQYWIDRFAEGEYELHLLKTIQLKQDLFERKRTHGVKWWYPKNAMVFVPQGITQAESDYDQQLVQIKPDLLTWRVRSKNPVFNLMADRDYYEYLRIVERGIREASGRLKT
ncbi:MAG: class I SAM-dependent methyltransferase [Acidiferrobacterales bacterium]|nr:class I SAM-dependent methyltransferase [Acidiferrobacterales bacterium]